jgi:polysaccharide biosynthesis protein PslH
MEALRDLEVVVAAPGGCGSSLAVPQSPLTMLRAASRVARERLPLHTLLGARDWHSALARTGQFDTAIVLLTRTDPWAFHAAKARRWILDAIDSAAVGMNERAAAASGPARAFWKSEARKAERLERNAAERYDSIVTVTPSESARFGAKGVVLPIGVAVSELGDAPRTIDFGFWGRLGYFANEQAVRTIVTRIWPRIRRQHSQATLFLGGSDAPSWMRRLHGRDRITVESPMTDREKTLRRIKVALLPISFGSGQSLKTLEAAEAGCAIAGTSLAFRGCDQLVEAAAIEDDLDRLADRALNLLIDDDARSRASAELRARVSHFYSREATLEQMRRLVGVN